MNPIAEHHSPTGQVIEPEVLDELQRMIVRGELTSRQLGGPGSGDFGHSGRPGEQGGSLADSQVGQAWKDGEGHLEFVTPHGQPGVFIAHGESRGAMPPKGKLLASYTDTDGYTITIYGGTKPPQAGMGRKGRMVVTAPDGKRQASGFFMGWPEKTWTKDVQRTYKHMSWEHKAALEVKQQATAYQSLKEGFADRIKALGGPGSGYFGHAGRPGEVGGSLPATDEAARRPAPTKEEIAKVYELHEQGMSDAAIAVRMGWNIESGSRGRIIVNILAKYNKDGSVKGKPPGPPKPPVSPPFAGPPPMFGLPPIAAPAPAPVAPVAPVAGGIAAGDPKQGIGQVFSKIEIQPKDPGIGTEEIKTVQGMIETDTARLLSEYPGLAAKFGSGIIKPSQLTLIGDETVTPRRGNKGGAWGTHTHWGVSDRPSWIRIAVGRSQLSYLDLNDGVEGPLKLGYGGFSLHTGGAVGPVWSMSVNGGVMSTFRHELGHEIQHRFLTPDQRKEWLGIYTTAKNRRGANKLETKVSRYSRKNDRELFAESFAAYTHPNYQRGMLPPEIETFMSATIGDRKK